MDISDGLSQDSLFDKVPSPVFKIEFDGTQYIFTDSNAAGHMFTDGRIADLFGRDIFAIWSTPHNRHIAYQAKLAHEKQQKLSESFWHDFVSDGKRRYINIQFVPYGQKAVLLFVYDLTKEYYKSQSLSKLDVRYRALFERASIGILEGLPEKFIDCNQQICDLYGYNRADFLNLNLPDICHHEDLPSITALFDEITKTPLEVYLWRGRAIRVDGSSFWVKVSLTGIMDDSGDFQHYLASVDDDSDTRIAEMKLQNAFIDTVKAIAATVEKHDRYTAGHMERVAEISVEIGRSLGLSEDELLGLKLGASIHDIGKVGIPSSILSKPGKLSDAEYTLIKDHPRLGMEIIKDIEFGWPIHEMVLQHHERLDGSGYPSGLKGDEISQEAQIIAVADVFEALNSHRPYRAAFDLNASLEILDKEKGRLRAEYVDLLISLINQNRVFTQ